MSMQTQAVGNQQLQQAEALLQQNRLDDAEVIYRQMLNQNFLPGVAHYRLGIIANYRGNYETAIEEHRRALETDPTLAAKILPQGSPLQRWVAPASFDNVEVKTCPVCGSKKHEIMNVVNALPSPTYHRAIDPIRIWDRCNDCGHGFVRSRPSDAVLKTVYEEPPAQHLQIWNYNLVAHSADILNRLIKHGAKIGALLDVGTAAGVLAGVAKDYGFQATGMDIHPIYRENVERFGATFIEGDFATYDFGRQKFDVVTFGNVLEHIVDLKKAIKNLDTILNKGGLVWVSVPNHDCAWTRVIAANDPLWIESENIHNFSKKSAEALFKEGGFKVVDYQTSKRFPGSVEFILQR